MCGRTCCTLTPSELCLACSYETKPNTFKLIEWKDIGQMEYKPSHNMCPTQTNPVIILKRQFDPGCEPEERLLVPMRWGFVPPDHKGTITSHGLKTNNCRAEGMNISSLYSGPFLKGQRCVVLCEGFYEWKNMATGKKQPYFTYLPQPEGVRLEDRSTWNMSWNEKEGWHGPRLLPMAGLYGKWTSPEGEEIWNYTVVTMESFPPFGIVHKRMPLILDSDKKVKQWLLSGPTEALSMVQPPDDLKMHQVTAAVGNVRFNEAACVQPAELKTKTAAASEHGSRKLMETWLNKAKSSPEKDQPSAVVPNSLCEIVTKRALDSNEISDEMGSQLERSEHSAKKAKEER